jgi:flagellar hook-associated protein 2
MGQISANTGLSSGINITGTISKLMAIDSQPVNALTTTDTDLTNQETAVSQLSALLLSVQDITQTLGKATTFGSQTATSSDTSVLAATVTGTPAEGSYEYTPLQMAQSQQLLSSGFQSTTTALGGGTLTFRYGNTVDQGVSLADINGGQGFAPGEIRITDRSGASAVINLSDCQNIDDVVQAINSAGTIGVTASTDDGHIVLTDTTGANSSALQVQEVDGGTTAASLGLVSPASSTANSITGSDILTLSSNLQLNALNDGMGVQTNTSALGDIDYTLHDGTSGTIDLSQFGSNPTLGDVIQQINSQSNGNLQASISANGLSLVVEDTTTGSGTFSISDAAGSSAASDLGLVDSTAASTVTSSQILGGLDTTLGGISYTLHDGASGTINLAQLGSNPTLGDVIQQINTQSDGNLQASMSADGQSLVVEDTTTGSGAFSLANATGSTAATDLGLVDSTSAGSITGSQVVGGLNIVLGGINYTLRDGTSGTIDLAQLGSNPTVGDVIQQISAQSGGALQASISGQGLVVKDTTSGSGTFSLANAAGSTAASDLGLVDSATTAAPSTITGSQVLGGLNTVLLSDLNGGQGLGTLGTMTLTDGNGTSAAVNLAGAATLQDVIGAINSQIQTQNTQSAKSGGAAVDITAEVNSAGDGIQLVDSSGGTAPLTAANGNDGLDTATKLGFATASGPGSSSTGTLNSGDMHLQSVSQNTLLSSYNGGAGVAQGSFQITDSAGAVSTIDVDSSMQTIGDVINAINRNTAGVFAAINSTGDGIVLTDTANGSGTLNVTEGNSTTAHDLNLLGTETTATVGGPQTINGSTTQTITLQATDTLTDLQNDINNLGAGLSAAIISDGSSNPYRLSLTATQSGQAGNMIVDASQISGMSLQEMTQGQDARLALGNASASNASASNTPVVVSSSSNTFANVLSGVSLQINSASGQPVSVTVGNDGSNIATNLQTFVTNYNSFRSQLTTDTAYNTTTETGAVLSNDGSALELDTQLSQLLTSSFASSGPVQSLADVGITVQSDGTLSFNQTQFDSVWSSDPTAVQQMFTAANTGVSAQFDTLINQLAGPTDSLLSTRATALQSEITDNQSTITQMNQRLSDEQNLLYTEFYNMDLTIGKLKNTQSVISTITGIAPDFGGSNSSSSSGSSS